VDFLLPIRQLCRDEGAKMTRRPRRNHSPAFEAKVALAALKGDSTMSELATQFGLNPNQIKQWKDQLLDGVSDVFDDKPKGSREPEIGPVAV
jgi:transposase-like protein